MPTELYQRHLPDAETGRVDGARGAEALPLTWGSHSRAGDDPIRSQRENQDAFIVEDCFCEDRYQLFAAVMDGHGPNGANVALFARDQLAEACIERKKRLQEQPREVLLEAHADVAAKLRGPENEIDQYVSGTSSLCVLVQPTCMWFANLGDCRAVIGQVRQPIRMRRGKEIKEPVNAELARERRAENRANKQGPKPDDNILNEGLISEADATTTAAITATKSTQGEATDETARNATSSTNTDASPMATNGDDSSETQFFGTRAAAVLETLEVTRDHTPDLQDESERILASGGRVFSWGVPRVWLQQVDMPGLAMTRSFGDVAAHTVGVIDVPELFCHKIDGGERFVVIATDGVWSLMSSVEVVELVGDILGVSEKTPKDTGAVSAANAGAEVAEFGTDPVSDAGAREPCNTVGEAQQACDALVQEALRRWQAQEEVVDDITAVVIAFHRSRSAVAAASAVRES